MDPRKDEFLSTIVGYVSDLGSHWDPIGKEGLAMVLAASYKYGTISSPNSADIFSKIESTGASLSVYADLENLVISISVPSGNLAQASKLLDEIVNQPKCSEGDLDKIKEKLKSQILSLRSNDFGYAATIFDSLVLSERIEFGTVESIDSITLEDLVEYQGEFKKRSVRFEQSRADELKIEDEIKKNRSSSKLFKEYGAKRALFLPREIEQKVVLFGYKTKGVLSSESEIRGVSSTVMSSGLSGIVTEIIREEKSAAYYADYYNDVSSYKGVALMYAGVSETNVEMVIELMGEIFQKVSKGEFKDERLENAKQYYLGKIDRAYDSIDSVTEIALSRKVYGLPARNYDEIVNNVTEVTKEDVIDYFDCIVKDKKPYLLINGDLPKSLISSLEGKYG